MPRVKKDSNDASIPMEPKSTKGRGKTDGFTSDLKSIRVTLTSEDKKRIPHSQFMDEDMLTAVSDYLDNGRKFSCSLDADNATYIATLTHFDESSPTHKHCLQGRGKTLVLAWASLRYKDVVLLGGDWESVVVTDDEYGLS